MSTGAAATFDLAMVWYSRVILTGWFALLSWQDFKKKQVGGRAILSLLLVVVVGWVWRREWTTLLFVAFTFVADYLPRPLRIGLAGSLAVGAPVLAVSAEASIVVCAWFVLYLLWELHVVGGADAKVAMTMVGLWPSMTLIGLLMAFHVLVSLGTLIHRYGVRGAGIRVWIAIRRALRFDLPTEEELDEMGDPMMLAYGLAGLVYVWAVWR